MRLLTRHRQYVRAIARAATLEAGGDKDLAIQMGERTLRSNPGSIIGVLLINLAVTLLVKLIEYFIEKYLSNQQAIPDSYQEDEPGFEGWRIER
jgi:hypothetical protein